MLLNKIPLILKQMSVSASNSLSKSFLYFAYGSNLLTERIHINNPSALKQDVAKLKGYRLEFNHYSDRWKGAVATIEEDPDDFVYGVLWKISEDDMEKLNQQEGVHMGIYRPIEVSVETQNGKSVMARSYQLLKRGKEDRRPSLLYHSVILKGAREHGLPQEYISALEKIPHNGNKENIDINISL